MNVINNSGELVYSKQWIVAASLFVVVTIFFSCSGNPEKLTAKETYFDLTGFFDTQVAQLYRDSLISVKTAEINDNRDQHEMQWTDWRKEFAPFYASEINKASYIGKYRVDTVHNPSGKDSTETLITMSATDPSLKTQLMEVTVQQPGSKVALIHIVNHTGSFLSTSDEELYYETMKSYIIKSRQQMRLFGENTFAVKGDIVSKKRKYF